MDLNLVRDQGVGGSNPLVPTFGINRNQQRTARFGFAPERAVDVKMKESARYAKIVEWSDEDQCFVGSCPGLLFGGCHGDDEQTVFSKLCEIVEETLDLFNKEGRPLPTPTAGKDYANKMLEVV